MKKVLLFLASLLIGIELFVWVGEVIGWHEIKKGFLSFTCWQGVVILGLTFLIALVGIWRWKAILRAEDVNISFVALIKPYFAWFSVVFLAPIMLFGGEFFRAYIIKEKNSVPWSKGMSSVIVDRVLEWTANLVVIFLGLFFFLYKIGLPPKNLGMLLGAALAVFVLGIGYFYLKVFKKESVIKIIGRWFGAEEIEKKNTFLEIEQEIFNFFKPKKLIMWKGFGLAFFKTAIMYIRAWLLIGFLGKSVGGLSALSVLGFSYLAAMIPIPAALGSHEAIQIFSFTSLGLGASSATAFTMAIRVAELIIALTGVLILFKLGIELLKNTLSKKAENLIVNNGNGENS